VKNASSYESVLQGARAYTQESLALLDSQILACAGNAPQGLRERLETMAARPGKRIRSILLFLLANPQGAEAQERAVRAAAAVEMLHLASLVHDDIIDESELRRGAKAVHRSWGNKIAVLVGDYILAQSMIFVIGEPDRRLPRYLAQTASDLVAGEIMELDLASRHNVSIEEYLKIIEGKTASLVEASARSGAVIAGFSQELVDACGELGRRFGLAFQIIDDLLDYGVGAGDLGKNFFGDLGRGLATLPLLLYYRDFPAQEAEMRALLARTHEDGVAEEIVNVLDAAGSFEEAKRMAMEHLDAAGKILEKLPQSPATEILRSYFEAVADRSN
jgi:octaprenyl-diphosphate synthase